MNRIHLKAIVSLGIISTLVAGSLMNPTLPFVHAENDAGKEESQQVAWYDKKWSRSFLEAVTSGPLIGADGTIFIGTANSKLYAINQDGIEKWTFSTGGTLAADAVLGVDGNLYLKEANELIAIDQAGVEKWRHVFPNQTTVKPLTTADGTVYQGTRNGKLHAIDQQGAEIWTAEFGEEDSFEFTPMLAPDGTLYIGTYDSQRSILTAIDADGKKMWTYQVSSEHMTSPVLAPDGTIYVGGWDGTLHAVSSQGAKKWVFHCDGGAGIPFVARGSDGTLYIAADKMYALTPEGEKKWSSFQPSYHFSSIPVIAADGTIYAGTFGGREYAGKFYAFHPDGTKKWEFSEVGNSFGEVVTIGSDGTIYLHSVGGNWSFYAINPDGTLRYSFPGGFNQLGENGVVYIAGNNLLNVYTPVGEQFSDVSRNHWVIQNGTLQWAYENKVVRGYPDGTFRADATVTEAEFLAMLIEAYKVPNGFDETTKPAETTDWTVWYYNISKQMNWQVAGETTATERNQPVKRGAVADLLAKAASGTNLQGSKAIEYLLQNGLSNGKDPTADSPIKRYLPDDYLNRAEAVQFIRNFQRNPMLKKVESM